MDEKHQSANLQHRLAEILVIFGLKTPLHAYVLGEPISIKNELYKTNVKSKGFIYRTSYIVALIYKKLHNNSIYQIMYIQCRSFGMRNGANYYI